MMKKLIKEEEFVKLPFSSIDWKYSIAKEAVYDNQKRRRGLRFNKNISRVLEFKKNG